MDKLYVIKIGGNIIDDEKKLSSFLRSFAAVSEKILAWRWKSSGKDW
jgi:acetylglutamate kinase